MTVAAFGFTPLTASSHREAPLISQDPLADNTDVYAFVSPERPDRVVLIANFIPLQFPSSGPNFWRFDDNVLYEIMVDNTGDAVEDVTFQFTFTTWTRNPGTFLYNTGQVTSIDDPDLNVLQYFTLTRVVGPRRSGARTVMAEGLHVMPANVGVSSMPNYRQIGNGVHLLPARVCRPARRGLLRRPWRHVRSAPVAYRCQRTRWADRQSGRPERALAGARGPHYRADA
jgi:hypothetical protein